MLKSPKRTLQKNTWQCYKLIILFSIVQDLTEWTIIILSLNYWYSPYIFQGNLQITDTLAKHNLAPTNEENDREIDVLKYSKGDNEKKLNFQTIVTKLRKENAKKVHCISEDDTYTASNERRLVILKNSDSRATMHQPLSLLRRRIIIRQWKGHTGFTLTYRRGSYMNHGDIDRRTIDQRRSPANATIHGADRITRLSVVIWPHSYGQFYRIGSRFNDNSKWHRYSETTADDAPAVAIDR